MDVVTNFFQYKINYIVNRFTKIDTTLEILLPTKQKSSSNIDFFVNLDVKNFGLLELFIDDIKINKTNFYANLHYHTTPTTNALEIDSLLINTIN
jgi:hypothetical protein